MADYTPITDSQVDPDAPLTSELAYAWRDNPIAITEGALGAPRILDAALSTTATDTGRDWVLNRLARSTVGAIGTFAFMVSTTAATYSPGATLAGSSLRYADATQGQPGSGPPGTWRIFGYSDSSSDSRSSLWMRIS